MPLSAFGTISFTGESTQRTLQRGVMKHLFGPR